MPLDFRSLPRDDNGIIRGRYRVRVRGMVREDLERRAVEGPELQRLVAAVTAAELEIEPWDRPKAPAPRRRRRGDP